MNKPYFVHLKNKYPSCKVSATDDALDVYTPEGEHLVAVRKDGNGMWVDASADLGCVHRFDLAPIPKHARHFKLFADGKCGPAEEADRRSTAEEYEGRYGKVPSLAELAKGDASLLNNAKWLEQFADGEDAVLPAAQGGKGKGQQQGGGAPNGNPPAA